MSMLIIRRQKNGSGRLPCLELRGIVVFDGRTRNQSEFYEWGSGTPDPQAAPARRNVWLRDRPGDPYPLRSSDRGRRRSGLSGAAWLGTRWCAKVAAKDRQRPQPYLLFRDTCRIASIG